MVNITSKVDAESTKEFGKISRILAFVAMILGIVGVIYFAVKWAVTHNPTIVYIMIYTAIFILGLIFFIILYVDAKKTVASNFVNDFIFDDDAFNVTTHKNGEVIGTRKIYYNEVSKIKETDLYVFIYVYKSGAYVLNKKDASKEDLTEVLNLINSGMKK